MELRIQRWGVLSHCTVPLPGLTVIAGANATGKSTVGRLLLAAVKAISVDQGGVEPAARGRSFISLWNDIFGNSASGAFELVGDRQCAVRFEHTGMRGCHVQGGMHFPVADATMVETPLVALLMLFLAAGQYGADLIPSLYPYAMVDMYSKMLDGKSGGPAGAPEVAKGLADGIARQIRGRLDGHGAGIVFVEERSPSRLRLSPKDVAAGQLGLAVFAKLLENGWIAGDTLTVFDEPENHIHPDWQSVYAEFLVRCVEDMGATIVVNTHTPHMLHALKRFSDQRIAGRTAFCLAERCGGSARIVTDSSPELAYITPRMAGMT